MVHIERWECESSILRGLDCGYWGGYASLCLVNRDCYNRHSVVISVLATLLFGTAVN